MKFLLKKWLISFVILTTLTNPNCVADEAQYLEKGVSAPFTGYLLTPQEAKILRNKVIDGETYQFQAESFKRSLEAQKFVTDLAEQKVKLYSENSDKLAKELQATRSMSDLTKVFWFAAGIIATVGAGLAIGKASK